MWETSSLTLSSVLKPFRLKLKGHQQRYAFFTVCSGFFWSESNESPRFSSSHPTRHQTVWRGSIFLITMILDACWLWGNQGQEDLCLSPSTYFLYAWHLPAARSDTHAQTSMCPCPSPPPDVVSRWFRMSLSFSHQPGALPPLETLATRRRQWAPVPARVEREREKQECRPLLNTIKASWRWAFYSLFWLLQSCCFILQSF